MASKSPISEETLQGATLNALTLASEEATNEWKNDLIALFHNAKDRFADIAWTTIDSNGWEVVWGHKAIVYARDKAPVVALTNPPSRNRAFSFKYIPSHPPTRTFDFGNGVVHRTGLDEPHPPHKRLPKPPHAGPSVKPERTVTILESTLPQAELSKEILSLYTVDIEPPSTEPERIPFPRLSDSPIEVITNPKGQKANPIEDSKYGNKLKLLRENLWVSMYREQLVTVWKDKLHCDIQVSVPWIGQDAIKHREKAVYRFSTHRSILASRSPVLRNVLMGTFSRQNTLISLKKDTMEHRETMWQMTLPYPPFTPSSFYYILGYMYTGTIYFRPDRGFSLNTAFAIVRGSIFLSLLTLQKLVVAHIVVKMAHGLFHAYLTNAEYARIVGLSWSKMEGKFGCHCKGCMALIPRILQFALGSNVHSYVLQRGARRALIGMFGLGWCLPEFALMPRNIRDSILSDMIKMVTPMNALALLFASQRGLQGLDLDTSPRNMTVVREMIQVVRDHVDEVLCKDSGECFDSEEWKNIISMDTPTRKEQLEMIMTAVLRAVKAQQALYITSVYKTFESLEIPDTPGNFFVKAIVERIKCELLSNMAPMLSSSAMSFVSVSTQLSFVTAPEDLYINASHSELSHHHTTSRPCHTISLSSQHSSEPRSLRTRRSSVSSVYSDISYQTIPWSLPDSPTPGWLLGGFGSSSASDAEDPRVEWNVSRSDLSVLALDLADSSIYSRASSRTLSTDYGFFYTRHAPSDWSINTLRTTLTLRRRNSWDSLTSV